MSTRSAGVFDALATIEEKMYSPFYFYFNLRYDAELTESKPVETIKSWLKEFNQIQEKQRVSYENSDHFPWINITLLNAKSDDSWAKDDSITECNVIAVEVQSTSITRQRHWKQDILQYVDLLKKIADLLNWELIDEETEDGIEDYVIYSSRIKK